jgi:hypothetical protein
MAPEKEYRIALMLCAVDPYREKGCNNMARKARKARKAKR